MATALQQQLAVIAANSTHQLDLKAQKSLHSKSLLFEPSDAASQSFETIYQLCYEGFEELCRLDSRFMPFARNLFSEQSRDEDRTQMTAAENVELDRVILSFLGLAGGRLLLKPGIRATEWLVRRFRVQEYNTEALILTFLPYHTSHVFPALLSILPKELGPTFRFLHPYMNSLANPPRHVVVSAAINNQAFFSAFSNFVLGVAKARHHSALLLGFWASVTAQAINGMIDSSRSGRDSIRKQREEDLLVRVLPILLSALAISGVPELFLGACMIVTILVMKVSLSDKAIDAMMEAITAAWEPQTADDGLVCLAVMAEEKRNIELRRTVCRAIAQTDNVVGRIKSVSGRHRVQKLALGMCTTTLNNVAKGYDMEHLTMVKDVATSGILSDGYLSVLFERLLTIATSEEVRATKEGLSFLGTFATECIENSNTAAAMQRAVEESGIDIEQLETRLQMVLPRPTADEDSHEDLQMIDPDAQDQKAGVDVTAVMAKLVLLPQDSMSYLDPAMEDAFTSLVQAFVTVMSSDGRIENLLGAPLLLRTQSFEKPAYFSFLARLWCSQYAPAVQVLALQMATKRLLEHDGESLDMQALFPYALAALANPAERIRRAAADFALALERLYKSGTDENKVSKSLQVWCKATVYGAQSKNVQWLPAPDAYRFLTTAVIPKLEEAVLDPASISKAVFEALNGSSATSSVPHIELKSSSRSAVFSYLASHVSASPVYDAKLRLLDLLNRVGKAGSSARGSVLLPFVQSWACKSEEQAFEECTSRGVELVALDRNIVGSLSHRSADELQCLKAIASGESTSRETVSALAFARLRQLWTSMKSTSQKALTEFLLDLALEEGPEQATPDRQAMALDSLRNLQLSTEVLAALIDGLPAVAQMQDHPPPTKKRRRSKTETSKGGMVDIAKLNAAVRKITVVLELVEGSKPERRPELMKGLFHVLGELHHYRTLLGSELVYLQGLVLGCLLAVVDALQATPSAKPDHSIIRADLVVECVRSTQSTQIHNAALLVISSLARWAPDLVLHSVMPIFTFMSTTLLRQSDDYSAHVIDQTISQVIPPLAASLRKKGKDLISGTSELLLSFTAAFEHVPLHRRLRLFTHLVKTLGAEESLAAVVAMLVEKHPEDTTIPQFTADLMATFPTLTQLSTTRLSLELIEDAMQPKRTISDVILGSGEKTKVELEDIIQALLLNLGTTLLADRRLQSRISHDLGSGEGNAESLRSEYANILEKAVQLSRSLSSQNELAAAAERVLSALLQLFPIQDFVASVKTLLETSTDAVRRHVLSALEARIASTKRGDKTTQEAFIRFLPSLSGIISQSNTEQLKHAAITCIDAISEKFGKKDRNAIFAAAQIIAGEHALCQTAPSLRIISILCLASMIEVLQDDFIPILPAALTQAFDYLQVELNRALPRGTPAFELHNAVLALTNAVLDNVPWMLSATLLDRILRLLQTAAASIEGPEESRARETFSDLAPKKIAPEELLAAIERTWSSASEVGTDALELQLEILHRVIRARSKPVIVTHAQTLFSIMLQAFDYRRTTSPMTVEREIDYLRLEYPVNEVVLDMVLKLNDATFRPFYIRLVEWAADDLPKSDRAGMLSRAYSLYSFSHAMSEHLKSIVTSYASSMLEHAVGLLSSLESADPDQKEVLDIVLQALASSFRHDQDDFWQAPQHFIAIAEPLLKQLTHAMTIDLTEHVVSTITDFAAAVASPEHFKELNASLMKLGRSDDARVRLATILTELSISKHVGGEWVEMLPEMLPFMSELLEDDDEAVERETITWIRWLEQSTGEDIFGMLQ